MSDHFQTWPPIHAPTPEALNLAVAGQPEPPDPQLSIRPPRSVTRHFVPLHTHNDPHRPGESIQFNIDSRQHDFGISNIKRTFCWGDPELNSLTSWASVTGRPGPYKALRQLQQLPESLGLLKIPEAEAASPRDSGSFRSTKEMAMLLMH